MVSAYGVGVGRCLEALRAGRSAFRPAGGRLPPALAAFPVAAADAVSAEPSGRVAGLLRALFAKADTVPREAEVYAATTVGEIGRIEAEVLAGAPAADECRIGLLGRQVAAMLNLEGGAVQTISSACASSTVALALAASAIRRGETECALVVGCDALSEFVLSGFAALMALDPSGARPFDAARRGITLGEAAAFGLLMSRERAEREGRPCLGVIGGWGLTCDANHLTGPSRDGAPLAEAARAALAMAGCAPEQTVAVCAHGTGTAYNDQMEMLAFKRLFAERPRPVFSVKGGMGHTMGAAGLAEALLAIECLRGGLVPPTVGLREVSDVAQGWVSAEVCPVAASGVILTTNSGFGGVNAALAVTVESVPEAVSGAGRAAAARVAGEAVFAAGGEPAGAYAPPRQFGRFSVESRLAYPAVARALDAAGFACVEDGVLRRRDDGAAARVGVAVWDRDGSAAGNRAYFKDYAASGRVMGRGQLFAYTLPTSVAAECAIAFRLTGPLFYAAEPDGGPGSARRAAEAMLADGLAEAMVLLTVAADAARACVLVGEKGAE